MRLSIFFLQFSYSASAQLTVFNNSLIDSTKPILYEGVENRLEFKGRKLTAYDVVIFKGQGCYITKIDENKYIARGIADSSCIVAVTRRGRTVLEKEYRVNKLKQFTTTVGGSTDSILTVNFIKANPFLKILIPYSYLKYDVHVIRFHATFHTQRDSLNTNTVGHMLTDKQLDVITRLQHGDLIIFDEIYAVGTSSRVYKMPNFIITIK